MTNACRIAMDERGIFQWTLAYPSREAFEVDISRNELFVLKSDEKLKGCIVISTLMDTVYEPVTWLAPNDNNRYIHRLAVHPEFQGQGYARQLMAFAEKYARDNKAVSVRLDTFSQNKRNQKFYEQRGYAQLGDIYFPEQSVHPFHCYELIL